MVPERLSGELGAHPLQNGEVGQRWGGGEAAGLEVVESSIARIEFDAPLDGQPQQVVTAGLARAGRQFADRLSPADARALAVLGDPDDPRGATNRTDVFLRTSRQIVIARDPGRVSDVGQ